MEMAADKTISRLIEFLEREGWEDQKILELIRYITKE